MESCSALPPAAGKPGVAVAITGLDQLETDTGEHVTQERLSLRESITLSNEMNELGDCRKFNYCVVNRSNDLDPWAARPEIPIVFKTTVNDRGEDDGRVHYSWTWKYHSGLTRWLSFVLLLTTLIVFSASLWSFTRNEANCRPHPNRNPTCRRTNCTDDPLLCNAAETEIYEYAGEQSGNFTLSHMVWGATINNTDPMPLVSEVGPSTTTLNTPKSVTIASTTDKNPFPNHNHPFSSTVLLSLTLVLSLLFTLPPVSYPCPQQVGAAAFMAMAMSRQLSIVDNPLLEFVLEYNVRRLDPTSTQLYD